MKKIITVFSLIAVSTLVACTDKTEKKEVILVPTVAPAPVVIVKDPPVIIVKDPPSKGTNITLDKNGVKIETKKLD